MPQSGTAALPPTDADIQPDVETMWESAIVDTDDSSEQTDRKLTSDDLARLASDRNSNIPQRAIPSNPPPPPQPVHD